MKESALKVKGIVIQVYQKHQYKLELDNGHLLLGNLSGKMIKNRIWLNVGDECEVEISVYDLNKGRVIRRY